MEGRHVVRDLRQRTRSGWCAGGCASRGSRATRTAAIVAGPVVGSDAQSARLISGEVAWWCEGPMAEYGLVVVGGEAWDGVR